MSKEREARAVEEVFRQRMAFIKEQKQHRAAVMIQKHWRGYSARKPVAHLLGWARHKFRELDDVTRNSICYKVSCPGRHMHSWLACVRGLTCCAVCMRAVVPW